MERALFNLVTLSQGPDRWIEAAVGGYRWEGQGEEQASVNRLRRPSGTIDCGGQWGQLCTNCFFTSLWQRQQSQAGTHESYICFVAKAPGVNSLWLLRGLCVCVFCVGVCVRACPCGFWRDPCKMYVTWVHNKHFGKGYIRINHLLKMVGIHFDSMM